MSNVYFIGDLHFGHANITKFRTQFGSEKEHRQFVMETWSECVGKRDIVYVMGDAAFTQEGLDSIGTLVGTKILVRGNHDLLPTEAYLGVFKEIYGIINYKGLWLTHAPIHPTELYGRTNVHGHCHRGGPMEVHNSLPKVGGEFAPAGTLATYFNTCAEHLPTPYKPIECGAMREIVSKRIQQHSLNTSWAKARGDNDAD